MTNKYLEKIALLATISGAAAADHGDKVGGAVSGFVGGNAAAVLGYGAARMPGALAGAVAGGYLSGKLYSRVKDGFRSKADMAKHRALNNK